MEKEKTFLREYYEATVLVSEKAKSPMSELKLATDLDKIMIAFIDKANEIGFTYFAKWIQTQRTELSLCKYLEAIIKASFTEITSFLVHGLSYSRFLSN